MIKFSITFLTISLSLSVYGQQYDGTDIKGLESLLQQSEPSVLTTGKQAWRISANQRIETHRKQHMLIKVLDASGKPVEHAKVNAKLIKHDFAFGVVIKAKQFAKVKSVLADFSNQIGFGSALKYKRKDELSSLVPPVLDWATEHNIDVRGHNLVWPGWKFMHKDAQQYKHGNNNQGLKAYVDNQIEQAAKKWDVMAWDVVNEPLDNQDIQPLVADGDGSNAMAHWFKLADKYRRNKDALLYINENRIISASQRQAYRIDDYLEVIDKTIARGGPIEAIGMQARFRVDDISPEKLYQRLEKFSYLDLPIMATEFEIVDTPGAKFAPSALRRAEMAENYMTLLFSHPKVNGIMAWTLVNGLTKSSRSGEKPLNIPENKGLLNWDMSLPLNGKMWLYLTKQRWHTDVTQNTNQDGDVLVHGFKGQYEISVNTEQGIYTHVTTLKDQDQTITIKLDRKFIADKQNFKPNDDKASPETKFLYNNLGNLAKDKILFGHQDTTLRGIGWRGGDGVKSDVKSATGKLPAVYGWDLNNFFSAKSQAKDELMISRIKQAYQRGGINTLSWHMFNPVTGKNFYDTTKAVTAILPGGKKHPVLTLQLDKFADFVRQLVDDQGIAIPLIFRPYHEHTGSWFWWGKKHVSEEEYIALWRFTVNYLRDEQGLHNILYAYSPAKIISGSQEEYLWGYPGDDYIDILGYDHYTQDLTQALPALRTLVELAKARNKVPALTETGIPKGLSNAEPGNYFTERLLNPLKNDAIAQQIAYMMFWRNRDDEHFWIPTKDHKLFDDFTLMAKNPLFAFESDIPNIYSKNNE